MKDTVHGSKISIDCKMMEVLNKCTNECVVSSTNMAHRLCEVIQLSWMMASMCIRVLKFIGKRSHSHAHACMHTHTTHIGNNYSNTFHI